MANDRANRLREVFDHAADLPPESRHSYVNEACADDAPLAAEILSLLAALDESGDRIEQSAVALTDVGDVAAAVLDGIMIDGFTLVRLIGRGGSGSVYEAEQQSPRRRVAFKMLRAWAVTSGARRRFVDESSILARFRHPAIAQIYAAGNHPLRLLGDDARLVIEDSLAGLEVPWIAMELVVGARALPDYAADQNLTLEDRVRLFLTACDAVQHGHASGVIHRDLKPHNILVDRDGHLKIIDFGVARATGDVQQAHTITADGAIVGTLRYMSPEQCDTRLGGVDTRTDVYALGVVLYELLTHRPPYELSKDSWSQASRTICESPPILPRLVSPGLARDLQTVVLKALEKEPARRYQSVSELAADLRRFLAREPIVARRSTVLYRVTTFSRRRPAVMTLAVLAALGILAGIVGISVGLARERAARVEADHRRDQAEQQAWLANLAAADSAIRNGDGGTAMRRLKAIPAERRGWEWKYLAASADTSERDWQPSPAAAWSYPSPDGDAVASHQAPSRVSLYDCRSHELLWSNAHVPIGGACRWSTDGQQLAVPGQGEVSILNRRDGSIRLHLAVPGKPLVLGIGWSRDGHRLAATCANGAGVFIYDAQSGQPVCHLESTAWVYDADFDQSGNQVAFADTTDLIIADPTTGKVIHRWAIDRLRGPEFASARFAPDGQSVAVTLGNVVRILDVATGEDRATLRGHAQRVMRAEFDAAGTHMVTASIDRTLRVWNLRSPFDPVVLIGHDALPREVRFVAGAADPLQVVSTDEANHVRCWSPRDGGPRRSMMIAGAREFVWPIRFSDDGRRAVCIINDAIVPWSLGDRAEPLAPIMTGRRIQAASEDWPFVVGSRGDAIVQSYDAEKAIARWTSTLTDSVHKLGISGDGTIASASLNESGTIILLNARTGSTLGEIKTSARGIELMEFDHDGVRLLTRDYDGAIALWDVATRTLIRRCCPPCDSGGFVCFSDDGSLIAYSDGQDSVTVEEVASAKRVLHIGHVGSTVWSVAISPDHRRLAVGSLDRATHLYEMSSGDEVLQLRDHQGSVMSVAWTQDGRYLITGGYDMKAVVHDSQRADRDDPKMLPAR